MRRIGSGEVGLLRDVYYYNEYMPHGGNLFVETKYKNNIAL
jgi:hypothetical protein